MANITLVLGMAKTPPIRRHFQQINNTTKLIADSIEQKFLMLYIYTRLHAITYAIAYDNVGQTYSKRRDAFAQTRAIIGV
jgi:hypothetical protein